MSRKTEISFYLEVALSLASHYFVAILNNTFHFGNKKQHDFFDFPFLMFCKHTF